MEEPLAISTSSKSSPAQCARQPGVLRDEKTPPDQNQPEEDGTGTDVLNESPGNGSCSDEKNTGRPRKRIISVTDPVRHVSDHAYIPGLTSSHFEYLVTSSDDESDTQYSVRRRFSDFLKLADVLAETHRGYFIYPRPEKGNLEATAAGRTEAEFVEFRRVDLERYLTRLSEHSAVCRSEELAVFLEADGPLASSPAWLRVVPLKPTLFDGFLRLPGQLIGSESSVPSVQDINKNARDTNDVMRMFREALLKEEAQSAVPDDEVTWRQIRSRVERYSECLVAASTTSERLVRESERLSIVMGDIALSLIRMAKYEDEHGSPTGRYSPFALTTQAMAEGSRRCGMELAKISKMERHATEDCVIALEPINNQLAMVHSALNALQEREQAFLTMRCVQDHLTKAQSSLDVLERVQAVTTLQDPVAEKKITGLRKDVAGLEAALHAATATYEAVFRRNKIDYAKWLQECQEDIRSIHIGMSGAMLRHGNVVAEEYSGLLRDLRLARERHGL